MGLFRSHELRGHGRKSKLVGSSPLELTEHVLQLSRLFAEQLGVGQGLFMSSFGMNWLDAFTRLRCACKRSGFRRTRLCGCSFRCLFRETLSLSRNSQAGSLLLLLQLVVLFIERSQPLSRSVQGLAQRCELGLKPFLTRLGWGLGWGFVTFS